MEQPKPYDTTALRTLSHRWAVVALAMSGRLRFGPGFMPLLDKLDRIMTIIAKTDGLIRAREHYNMRLRLIARLVWDTFLRKKVKAIIGTGNIKRWWWQYHGHHETVIRGERKGQTSYQQDYQWKDYGLLPVPGYAIAARPKLSHYSTTSGYRQARDFPAFLFYPWQIEGQGEPEQLSSPACGGSTREAGDGGQCARDADRAVFEQNIAPRPPSPHPPNGGCATPPINGGRKEEPP